MKNSHRKEKETNNKINTVTKDKQLGKKRKKKSHSEERTEPYNTLNRTDNIEEELSEKWPQKIKEKKRNPIAKEPYTSAKKINAVTKDRELGKKA